MPTYAACFLCKFADEHIIKFAEEVATHHSVYIVCDKEPADRPISQTITSIHVDREVAIAAGFKGVNVIPWLGRDPCMALDKALYYFTRIAPVDYVWFIEEDVFLPRADILSDLNVRYPETDLITKEFLHRSVNPAWEGWTREDLPLLEQPHIRSMSCCVRLSRTLLTHIEEFVKQKGQLVFLELFFTSLAARHLLTVATPPELQGIQFRQEYTIDSFTPDAIVHPIKNTSLHGMLRHYISIRQMVGRLAPMIGHGS